ncbi:hypothetical protein DFH27DRAFT_626275 [Peziza echinospora]|nr:hypothetical protein DFH27DRAFT_626275 [Peziza echinospora]
MDGGEGWGVDGRARGWGGVEGTTSQRTQQLEQAFGWTCCDCCSWAPLLLGHRVGRAGAGFTVDSWRSGDSDSTCEIAAAQRYETASETALESLESALDKSRAGALRDARMDAILAVINDRPAEYLDIAAPTALQLALLLRARPSEGNKPGKGLQGLEGSRRFAHFNFYCAAQCNPAGAMQQRFNTPGRHGRGTVDGKILFNCYSAMEVEGEKINMRFLKSPMQ